MNRQQLRAYRETGEDPLWNTVWQIWPKAMMFEEETPFDAFGAIRRRRAEHRSHKHQGTGETAL